MHYPYYAFLESTGLKVGILNFSWTTTAFNRFIYRWSKNIHRFLRKWFAVGYFVTIALFLPFAIWTLISFIYEHFHDSIPITSGPEIQAMLPGVNVPSSDFIVYFSTIALSSIAHELGHAMAAAHEDVQFLSIGICVVAILPMAYVELNTEQLNTLPAHKRLKIYCAGIWHNIVCAFIALLLYFSSPVLFSVGYSTDVGIRVVGFSPDSPLKEARGLEANDVIVALNGCEVKNMKDWLYCMNMVHERYGICTTSEFISQHDEVRMEKVYDNNVVDCCGPENHHSFCFEYMEPSGIGDTVMQGQYSCLKPRNMVKDKLIKCTEIGGYVCPKNMYCLKPALHNNTYFMIIERKDKSPVLYLGVPQDLKKTVQVDQYFPRNEMFAMFSPMQFEKFLRYLFMFSMGIGFLNVIPCYGTDGHHIARNIIQGLAKYLNKNGDFVTFCTVFTVVVGTGFTIPILAYLFYKVIFIES